MTTLPSIILVKMTNFPTNSFQPWFSKALSFLGSVLIFYNAFANLKKAWNGFNSNSVVLRCHTNSYIKAKFLSLLKWHTYQFISFKTTKQHPKIKMVLLQLTLTLKLTLVILKYSWHCCWSSSWINWLKTLAFLASSY